MGGVVSSIGGALSDFANDPLSIAVPMYGITKGMVKMANGDYSNPQTGETVPAAHVETPPQAPSWSGDPAANVMSAANSALGAAKGAFGGSPQYFHSPTKGEGYIAGMGQKLHNGGFAEGMGADSFGPALSKGKLPEKAPFAGAWDYQPGHGAQWNGPKTGNRI